MPPQPPYAVPAAPVPAPTPELAGRRRKGLLFGGLAAIVVGLVGGGILVGLSSGVTADTVKGFARAPVGCTTTLQFDKVAVFTLFVETKGTAIDVGGDCSGNGAAYDRGAGDPPRVTLTMVDDNDTAVPLTDSTAYSYDTGDFRGEAIQQVEITAPGTYRLTVVSDDTEFAIAVGGDPEVDSSTMQALGGGVALAGLLLGVVLVVLGLRKRKGPDVAVSAAAPTWTPQATVPGYVPPAPAYQPPPVQPPPPPPAGPGWGAPQA
jgi:hypothetical protein